MTEPIQSTSADPISISKPMPQGEFLDIGEGHKVHYHAAGRPDASPVVFLHGSGPGASGYSNFKGNFRVIADAGFRALVPDTLGFGFSSKPEDRDYEMAFLVDATRRFLDALGVEKVSFVGNSHGGALGIQFALSHPERVKKLVLMAPGGLEERERYMEMRGIRSMVKAVFAPGGVTRKSLKKVLQYQLYDPSGVTDELVDERYQVAVTQPQRVLATLRVPHLAKELERITCPVLGFWGNDDQFCPVSGATTLSERVGDSRVMRVSKCGHWVMVEHCRMFNSVTAEFLSE